MVVHGIAEATGSDGQSVRVGLQRAQLGPILGAATIAQLTN